MSATRLAQLSIVLSAVTLALVMVIAARPAPEPPDNSAALIAIAHARNEIAELRTIVERGQGPSGSPVAGDIVGRLDRLEASLAAIAAKMDAICTAIETSPFAPSGFACP